MKLSDIMSAADLTIYPKIALVLFLFAFFLVVVRIYWPGARAQFAHTATLPLDDVNDRFVNDRFAGDGPAGDGLASDGFATGRAPRPDRSAITDRED